MVIKNFYYKELLLHDFQVCYNHSQLHSVHVGMSKMPGKDVPMSHSLQPTCIHKHAKYTSEYLRTSTSAQWQVPTSSPVDQRT